MAHPIVAEIDKRQLLLSLANGSAIHGHDPGGPGRRPRPRALRYAHLLEAAGDIEIVAEAEDGDKALALVEANRPDVLVTDIEMPGLGGLELTERVVREFPATKVLILSIHKKKEYATKAITCGASGYLLKDAGEQEYSAAVRAVFRGESYLSPAISAHVVAEYGRWRRRRKRRSAADSPPA